MSSDSSKKKHNFTFSNQIGNLQSHPNEVSTVSFGSSTNSLKQFQMIETRVSKNLQPQQIEPYKPTTKAKSVAKKTKKQPAEKEI